MLIGYLDVGMQRREKLINGCVHVVHQLVVQCAKNKKMSKRLLILFHC